MSRFRHTAQDIRTVQQGPRGAKSSLAFCVVKEHTRADVFRAASVCRGCEKERNRRELNIAIACKPADLVRDSLLPSGTITAIGFWISCRICRSCTDQTRSTRAGRSELLSVAITFSAKSAFISRLQTEQSWQCRSVPTPLL